MKVLLKDEQARLYYGMEHAWVADPNAAMDFQVLERAGQEASQYPLHTLAIVLRYENPECELSLNPGLFWNPQPGNSAASSV
ncbi:MAG TPA: hypothetical protein VFE51_12535 [Verrucomicrobiae bacterium]|nr:hypothetical protein [Verrucomicrobiae bacterium]